MGREGGARVCSLSRGRTGGKEEAEEALMTTSLYSKILPLEQNACFIYCTLPTMYPYRSTKLTCKRPSATQSHKKAVSSLNNPSLATKLPTAPPSTHDSTSLRLNPSTHTAQPRRSSQIYNNKVQRLEPTIYLDQQA
mmetsp:Transcript_43717/g.113972  ORF Transcript_43717/g.113972 Transcript_43717/m.113972 type:complete len:137 (-) Transcript_43717:82-492(-)